MNNFILNVLFFLVVFLLVFLADYYFVFKKNIRSKKKKNEEIMEFFYLINKFKLDSKKINYKKMAFACSIINAFIISSVVTVICLFNIKYIWKILIGFVLLMGLIYSIYEIYGRHLVKKWGKKDE